jgi:hypothetical protein
MVTDTGTTKDVALPLNAVVAVLVADVRYAVLVGMKAADIDSSPAPDSVVVVVVATPAGLTATGLPTSVPPTSNWM